MTILEKYMPISKGVKRYIDICLTEAEEVFRQDGTIFHHGTYYPKYSFIPLESAHPIINFISGTEYQPADETFYMIEKFYSNAFKSGSLVGSQFRCPMGTPGRSNENEGGTTMMKVTSLYSIAEAAKKAKQKDMFLRMASVSNWYRKKEPLFKEVEARPYEGCFYLPYAASFSKKNQKLFCICFRTEEEF